MPDSTAVRAARQRLRQHLPPKGDLELLVLKGHLVIEEALHALASRETRYPDALREGSFTFSEILRIAKSLAYAKDMDWLWQALQRLNKLRNEMAHNLEPQTFQKLLSEFVLPVSAHSAVEDPADMDGRARETIEVVHFILSTYSNKQFDHGKPPNFHASAPPNKTQQPASRAEGQPRKPKQPRAARGSA